MANDSRDGKRQYPDVFAPLGVHFFENSSIAKVGPMAKLMYIAGMLRSKRAQTFGVVESSWIAVMTAELGITKGARKHIQSLLDAGLWEKLADGNGWKIPDEVWAKWHQTKEQKERNAAISRANGAQGGRPAGTQTEPKDNPNGTQEEPEEKTIQVNTKEEKIHTGETPLPATAGVQGESPVVCRKLSILPPPTPEQFVDEWNMAVPFAQVKKFGKDRIKHLDARRREKFWLENYAEALARIPKTAFLRGEGNTGWKADIDWFLKPDSVTRILEGKYDGSGTTGAGSHQNRNGRIDNPERLAATLAKIAHIEIPASEGRSRTEDSQAPPAKSGVGR
jgi:hypothetical protein